ncbi:hypothetical protein HNQ80_001194 [Anaerosolibacter carboniphilus]|uniref:Uncharacterized protein n=1 Tax=Anaerosolibacter carboniphilus TaxID=1417629 RepID=A0A841KY99_9FIRM|nr:hypothetical protein [Anaerosolibacter carboniphilus]MBB6215061.1 hypothetical protein [Anaerosolibacter carboniphilus]MBB6215105.1 hypothetical protein [Anaerosolibacter carboniphilus]
MFENREEKGDSPAMTSLEYATDSCGWNITKETSSNLFEEMIKKVNIDASTRPASSTEEG